MQPGHECIHRQNHEKVNRRGIQHESHHGVDKGRREGNHGLRHYRGLVTWELRRTTSLIFLAAFGTGASEPKSSRSPPSGNCSGVSGMGCASRRSMGSWLSYTRIVRSSPAYSGSGGCDGLASIVGERSLGSGKATTMPGVTLFRPTPVLSVGNARYGWRRARSRETSWSTTYR